MNRSLRVARCLLPLLFATFHVTTLVFTPSVFALTLAAPALATVNARPEGAVAQPAPRAATNATQRTWLAKLGAQFTRVLQRSEQHGGGATSDPVDVEPLVDGPVGRAAG